MNIPITKEVGCKRYVLVPGDCYGCSFRKSFDTHSECYLDKTCEQHPGTHWERDLFPSLRKSIDTLGRLWRKFIHLDTDYP